MEEHGGAELRRLRRTRGLTQDDLARRAGLSVRTVRNLETSQHQPHPYTAEALARALAVRTTRLLRLWSDSSAPPSVPPPASGPFVGRGEDLRRLEEAVAGAAVVAVTGAGGVGKTALCLQWIHRVRDRYPDGSVYVDLNGFHPSAPPLSPADALRRLLSALGEDAGGLPDDADDLAARYRAATADRRLVVLLDNAASSEQVRALLPVGAGSAAVVTSRRRLDGLAAGEAAAHLTLAPLDPGSAVELLDQRVSGSAARGRLPALAAACEGLPLALVVLAAHLGRNADRVLRATATGGAAPLDLLEVESGDRSLRRVLATTIAGLPAAAQSAAVLLGLWPTADFDVHVAAALSGSRTADAVRDLDLLADHHLIEERPENSYVVHDLVAAYLAERAAELPPDVRSAALRRLYRYELAVAIRCVRVIEPHRSYDDTDYDADAELPRLASATDVARYLTASQAGLTAVIRRAQRDRAAPYSWQLPQVAETIYRHRGPRSETIEILRAGADAAPADDPTRPALLNNLGIAYGMSGELEAALDCWRRALPLAVDATSAASYLTNIAIAEAELGHREAALEGYERALTVRRTIGDHRRTAVVLVNRARLLIDAGDLAGADGDLAEARQLAEEVGDDNVLGACLLELGRVRAARGDVAGGLELLAQVLPMAAAVVDDHLAAEVHRHTAELLPGDSDEAGVHLRAAYDLYVRIGDPWAAKLADLHPGLAIA